jgi:glycosyltransferase involved in cell wall biosynthesis
VKSPRCLIYAYKFELPSESGMAIQILSDCHAVAARGMDVYLYTVGSPVHPVASVEEGLAFYGLTPQPSLHVRRLGFARKSLRKRLAAPFFWAAVVRDLLQQRHANPVVLSRSRRITRWLLALRRALPVRYAVVHEIHEDGVKGLSGTAEPAAVAAERDFFGRLDAIVATSPAVGRHLRDAYGLGARVHIIPNGANVERFLDHAPPEPVVGGRSECVLAYAGAFAGWKQVPMIVEALCHLPSHVRLVVMGGKRKHHAADRAEFMQLADRLGVTARVDYRGFVPPADVPKALGEADILLLPLGDNPIARYFTCPLKLFEYMAMGLPIIAAAYPTITPFVADRVSALLVDPMTPATIARAVDELIRDPQLAAQLGRNARSEAPRYSRQRRAEQLIELASTVKAAA